MKKATLAAIALICLITAGCIKKELSLKVDGPRTYQVGALLVLDASESNVRDLKWSIFPSTANFSVNGMKAYFSSPNKETYTIVLSGTDGVKIDALVLRIKYAEIKVKVEVVDPFVALLTHWLPDDVKTFATQRLAQSFRSVAAISDSSFDNVEAMLLATAYSNRVALGDDLSTWQPFLDSLADRLENNPPKSVKDLAVKWNTIADMLGKL